MADSTTGAAMPVQVTRSAGFWFARLNRPEKRNAISEAMTAGLADLCGQVAADLGARALVLHGAGGNFCAGADLAGFVELMRSPAGRDDDPIARHNRAFGAMLEALVALPVPTLAVVTGFAMGGGCGLAAACDHVIAADDATFAMPEVTLGVLPAQIAPFVVRRVGATRGRWLMLTAARLTGREAVNSGLADVVAARGHLREAVAAELQLLAAAEPAALRATKRVVGLALDTPLTTTLDSAAAEFAGILRHGAAREGIAAQREKRAPAWRIAVPELPDFT
jgi:isohexenylglutaconyl-CoA hydratase